MDLPKGIRLVTVVFAVVAGLVAIPMAAMIIAILGLVTGYFVEEDRRMGVMVLALTLATNICRLFWQASVVLQARPLALLS